MPRIIVTTDPSRLPDDAPVLLDERVHSVHLSSGHAAHQLIERLAWAINDAEESESVGAASGAPHPRRPTRTTPTSPRSRVPRRRIPVGA
ncbi:MAG: hypothetical protein JWL67_598 [Solirubrobacterales bacterium]|jgi:hypothetical protein|nr:hypothetical protein [Solirubrobacterales bacterium]